MNFLDHVSGWVWLLVGLVFFTEGIILIGSRIREAMTVRRERNEWIDAWISEAEEG